MSRAQEPQQTVRLGFAARRAAYHCPVPSISVVIPAKDDAVMLERCLTALNEQSRPADEIIVVDNASTDATAAVGRRLGATVVTESRPGITAAASRGYDTATGDIIARCDADSLVPTDWLERIERTLSLHPEAVAVTGPATFYDLSRLGDWLARVLYLGAYFFSAGAALAGTPLFGSNFAMTRDLWCSVSASVPRDEPELHDDFDLSYRIHPGQQVRFDREMVVRISGRPFRSLTAMLRRSARAWTTMRLHFPGQLPHRRWYERARAAS